MNEDIGKMYCVFCDEKVYPLENKEMTKGGKWLPYYVLVFNCPKCGAALNNEPKPV